MNFPGELSNRQLERVPPNVNGFVMCHERLMTAVYFQLLGCGLPKLGRPLGTRQSVFLERQSPASN